MAERILFVCTLNSVRSVLAEHLLRHATGEKFEIYSAGIDAQPVHPLVIAVLAEVGIDCRHHAGQNIADIPADLVIDRVIMLSREAYDAFKILAEFPYKHLEFWDLPVPPADPDLSRETQMMIYRMLREAIKGRLEGVGYTNLQSIE
ncbi:MAG: hypothetical protein ACK5O9_02675 [Holosporales bacterium]|jgi:protein-tyrosine-phosphatase